MSDNRKYYYLKLKENYFDDDSIVLLESMQDGVLYSNILLKLYLKSLKHGGRLQLDEDIPYIISFDPRDGTDNGLTVDRAQELGEQFCKEHFPGHQALICTHPDGHNHSGNIHVHIVINSLRIYEVPLLPWHQTWC